MLRLLRSEVIEVVEPFLEPLYRVGAVPFKRYQREYPNRALHLPRTRACILYDLMVDQAQREFRGIRDAVILQSPNGVTLLVIGDTVCLRFKKLDDESLPRNYPTVAAKDWENGDDLPGIPSSLQRLSLGYRLNQLQTEVRDVLISNTLAGRLLYDIILEEPAAGVLFLDDRKNNSGNGGQSQKPQRRVRIRPSEEQAEM